MPKIAKYRKCPWCLFEGTRLWSKLPSNIQHIENSAGYGDTDSSDPDEEDFSVYVRKRTILPVEMGQFVLLKKTSRGPPDQYSVMGR